MNYALIILQDKLDEMEDEHWHSEEVEELKQAIEFLKDKLNNNVMDGKAY